MQNFPISGLKPRPAFIWSMAAIKRAAAEVNRDLGLLEAGQANAIAAAAQATLGSMDDLAHLKEFTGRGAQRYLPKWWAAIREAQERGEFDNLPGAGKPLTDLGDTDDPMWWVRR